MTQNILPEQESRIQKNSTMRKGCLFLLFILLQCHIGHAIRCQSCVGDCREASIIECGDQQCMTLEHWMDGTIQQQQKGCMDSQRCKENAPNPTLIRSCCNTDLCNVATTTTTASTSSASTASSSALACVTCNDYTCLIKSSVNCKPKELCLTKSATVFGVHVKKLGCANSTICSTQTTEQIMATMTTVDNKCCDSNLCNFGITLKMSSIATIGAVLFLWITKLY